MKISEVLVPIFARSGPLSQALVVSKIKIAKQRAGRQFVGKFGHNLPTLLGFTNILENRRIVWLNGVKQIGKWMTGPGLA